MNLHCYVCGGKDFQYTEVLWDALVREWQLSPVEMEYVNRQQGMHCKACGSNLRSIALAMAIMRSFSYQGTLAAFVKSKLAKKMKVLEINEAGNLHGILRELSQHQLVTYPQYDMMNLALKTGSFDLIVHSDTLEHVPDPITGLSECRRLLASSGRCIYTVPALVDRLTRSRNGLPPSYHGNPADAGSDFIVHSEFGADMWTFPVAAGFSFVGIHVFEYPSALAIECKA